MNEIQDGFLPELGIYFKYTNCLSENELYNNKKVNAWLESMSSYIDSVYSYHNHKESMAWASLAFYITSVILFSYHAELDSTIMQYFAGIVVVIFGAMVVLFINMQLEMRRKASSLVSGLVRMRSIILTDPSVIDSLDSFPPRNELSISPNRSLWPKLVQEQIKLCDPLHSIDWILKDIWVPWRWHRIDAALRSELASYAAIFLATAVSLLLIFYTSE